jgi:type III secretion protein L
VVGYYRLKELGFRLSAGAHVLPRAAFEPIEAANALVGEARAEASRIVAEAKDAFEAERRRGYAEGLARAQIEAVERLVGESGVLDRKLQEIEAGLTDLVVACARRLVAGFDDRQKAEVLVRAALRQMRREKKAELRVSPGQYGEMRERIGGIIQEFPEIDLVDVVEDASLETPNVIVETSIGRVEGDIGQSLDDLERVIRIASGVPAAGSSRAIQPAGAGP